MYFFSGPDSITAFRSRALLQKLKPLLPMLTHISAQYFFLVDVKGELDQAELQRLGILLRDSQLQALPPLANHRIYTLPRFGTISPWSSKATDIAHICGFKTIQRLERGVCYQLTLNHPEFFAGAELLSELHDPLTETVLFDPVDLHKIFAAAMPAKVKQINLLKNGKKALEQADADLGLALSQVEMNYLLEAYQKLKRNPTDAELMMFAQVNSEHCRHKIFNGHWTIDDVSQPHSLFEMIKHTYKMHPTQALVAYHDNAAVLNGYPAERFWRDPVSQQYQIHAEANPIVLKVETHNHPTAIAPLPGAATGSGGEIRDEAATGRGASPKAGLSGFSVSHLRMENFRQPWELQYSLPPQLASALTIMLEAPIGAAAFNNEFGRPNLCGYFRSFEMEFSNNHYRGYHKPIMLAGGIGNIRDPAIQKKPIPAGAKLIVLGGPAMAIGLGGGSASSRSSNSATVELDFASVQRANPELQRRCQEVINTCWALAQENPILSIHDVGAGGLANALPELVEASNRGADLQLREIHNAARGMSPLEIWCNEAQERYVLAINFERLDEFQSICERERCPFAVVGEATEKMQLVVSDKKFDNAPVNLPMATLFEDLPRLELNARTETLSTRAEELHSMTLKESIKRVLQFPCVSDKSFLITIGDRSVTGLVARDQMVGPWQIPVSDVAVTLADFKGYSGEALAMGERAPIALLNSAAAARIAVGEAITNIMAADLGELNEIALSANWMAAPRKNGEAAALFAAVKAIGMELCPELGISIPVGKDSLSMQASWQDEKLKQTIYSPISLVITAAAPIADVRRTLTPELNTKIDSQLVLIDLGLGANRLGASVYAQVQKKMSQVPPDINASTLKKFFQMLKALKSEIILYAYHDRSDGGLLATLCEMMFASHTGLKINLSGLADEPRDVLFNEELGAVIQVATKDIAMVKNIAEKYCLDKHVHVIGELSDDDQLQVVCDRATVFKGSRIHLQQLWSETSYRLQARRDNPQCAEQEFNRIANKSDTGLFSRLKFNANEDISAPYINVAVKPKVAILREQGVNGHIEMAAAFHAVGFDCIDVHMSELISGAVNLMQFHGLAACGGFSYGDVLGAGQGWAQSILMDPKLCQQFQEFFSRANTFSLGVCNGCQMFSKLKDFIPGASHWPSFERNVSEQFEARLVMSEILESPSIFLQGMAGSQLPIVVAHGEGQAQFGNQSPELVCLRYIDYQGEIAHTYPANPNGSVDGVTGLCSEDGRAMIVMPHPERIFRSVQFSWCPDDWPANSPWQRLFANARHWLN
ncbi:MAG: phosphoribosylformylglycinamidine synthase [Gammaproteobacteria bacterium]|nr:phosphoribosylformylglycinamidine synthase [Gammaproteobacteria bacterium]